MNFELQSTSAGQVHESTQVDTVMNRVSIRQPSGPARKRPAAMAGDKGYSYRRVRDWLRRHAIRAVIPRRTDQLVIAQRFGHAAG